MIISIQNIYSKIELGGEDYLINKPIQKLLKEFLSVYMFGYENTDKYISGYWDGKIPFINRSGAFLTGFLEPVLNFCISHGYKVELIDIRSNKIEQPKSLVTSLKPWELFPHQKEAVEASLNNHMTSLYFPRGIIKAATNAGKNSMIMSIVQSLGQGCNTLILVHRVELFKQLVDFAKECGLSPSIYNSKKKELGTFTIAMYKTMHSRRNDLKILSHLNKINCLIVDECHNTSAKTYEQLIKGINAFAKFYFSGTPLATPKEEAKMSIIGQSGPIIYQISNKELIALGISQNPEIYMFEYMPELHATNYYDALDNALYSLPKLSIIERICRKFDSKKILIVVEYKEHGNFLLDRLMQANIMVAFVHGQDTDRSLKIKRFKEGTIQVLIATMIFKEGINVQFSFLINAFGGKSKNTLKQVIGRLVRSDGIKKNCQYIDFIDTDPYLLEHTSKRVQLYEEEAFDVSYCQSDGSVENKNENFFDKSFSS